MDAYFAYPLALCARRVSSAASRLPGTTSLRFALHGWQRWHSARSTYLFPVRALSRHFRGKMVSALRECATAGKLDRIT
ncbi:transposase, partial [Thiolapillus sp.]|uniref:transposase n=1 Tax=Thiolapillus sp. TaxID=2017437 RepID=UPI0035AC1B27